MSEQSIKIAIAEPSAIIRSGMAVVLKRISGIHIQTFEIPVFELLTNYIRLHKPDFLIINPTFWGTIDVKNLKEESKHKQLKCIALLSNMVDVSIVQQYDEIINLYDSVEKLKEKLDKLLDNGQDETTENTETLSLREKEVLICVVKGLTNKEIALQLFLSAHTVMSHRKNIARKLEIHSTAGLTIYAIVNKLVELDEIKKDL